MTGICQAYTCRIKTCFTCQSNAIHMPVTWRTLSYDWLIRLISIATIRDDTFGTRKSKNESAKFKQWISCIASCALYHYTTSVHSMVISWVNTTLASPGTCWLESDVQRGSSRAPGSCHDVTSPDIDLNFSNTHFGSARDGP